MHRLPGQTLVLVGIKYMGYLKPFSGTAFEIAVRVGVLS
jgi:hypothetical protein